MPKSLKLYSCTFYT